MAKELNSVKDPKREALDIFASMLFAEDSKARTLICIDLLIKELKVCKCPSALYYEDMRKLAEKEL